MSLSKEKINMYMSVMAGPYIRLFIYITIASLTSLMNDFSKYQSLDEISQLVWIMILINFFLQGLIAWRAYIDGSYPEAVQQLQEGEILAKKQAELIKGNSENRALFND